MDILEFYSKQSLFTDPGQYADMYESLPKSAEDICKVLQGVFVKYEDRWMYPIPNENWLQTNYRYVEDVLKEHKALTRGLPLEEEHLDDQFLMANPGQFANMFVSIMRYNNIPARKRFGFNKFVRHLKSCEACYEKNGFKAYEIAEYYDAEKKQWIQVDPAGVLDGKFIPAAKVYQDWRAGKANAEKYFSGEETGEKVIISQLILDLAALNKNELITWDRYGWMLRPVKDFSKRAFEILDEIAEAELKEDKNLEKIQKLYQGEEGIEVPDVIYVETPAVPYHHVTLKK